MGRKGVAGARAVTREPVGGAIELSKIFDNSKATESLGRLIDKYREGAKWSDDDRERFLNDIGFNVRIRDNVVFDNTVARALLQVRNINDHLDVVEKKVDIDMITITGSDKWGARWGWINNSLDIGVKCLKDTDRLDPSRVFSKAIIAHELVGHALVEKYFTDANMHEWSEISWNKIGANPGQWEQFKGYTGKLKEYNGKNYFTKISSSEKEVIRNPRSGVSLFKAMARTGFLHREAVSTPFEDLAYTISTLANPKKIPSVIRLQEVNQTIAKKIDFVERRMGIKWLR